MPMAGEYLFAQSYGMGGFQAVVFTEALFFILSMLLAYTMARRVLPAVWAAAFLFSIHLLPQSYTFLFGFGKFDMVDVYLMLTAFSMLFDPMDAGRISVTWILFLFYFTVKCFSWLQLGAPMAACSLFLLRKREWRLISAVCALGLILLLSVMVKNQLQVGNPMAPFVDSKSRHMYLEKPGFVTRLMYGVREKKQIHELTNFLFVYNEYILCGIAIALLLVAQMLKTGLRGLGRIIPFLFLSLLP
jgi:hypothetical protein